MVQLVQLFSHYFHKVKEKNIRENFVLIYELLDEVCDYGIPQITDPFTLKAYIFQKGEYQTGMTIHKVVTLIDQNSPQRRVMPCRQA